MPSTSNRSKTLQRTKAQREALIRSLAISLIENHSIETTEPKAKTLRPFVEKLITKAKKGDLHSRRQVIASLHSIDTSNELVDEIAPKLSNRDSGYLRIKRTTLRRGDNAQMAEISFVDDLSAAPEKPAAKKTAEPKAKAKKTEPKKEKKEDK